LNLWLENGLELGNHTFAHTSLNRVPLQTWQEDVERGETVTRMLLASTKCSSVICAIHFSTPGATYKPDA
jgi:hypothetical protein